MTSQSTAIAPQEQTALQPSDAGGPLSAVQLRSRLHLIQDVMRSVMQDGQDYGVIPGTDKPTLYKPGAEKLCVTFRLAAGAPMVEQVPEFDPRVIRYRVQVPVLNADGSVLAFGGVVLGVHLRAERKRAARRFIVERLRSVMEQREQDQPRRIVARTEHDQEAA